MVNSSIPAARFVAALLCVGMVAFAQTERGTVRGTVTDTTGATIGDVTVTAINQDTGVVSETVSTAAGIYQIPQIRPGSYTG